MKLAHKIVVVGFLVVVVVVGGVALGEGSKKTIELEAAEQGGDYLVRHLNEDGSFVYEYNPVTGEISPLYNILRHAGTTYSLLELYQESGERRYLDAAHKALDFLVAQARPCPIEEESMCIVEGDDIKLGGNGLAVLALVEYERATGSEEYREITEELANFLVAVESSEGEFLVHKMEASTGRVSSFISGYYPGEAIFGLARLGEVSGDERWTEAAHAAARWLITVRDGEKTVLELDHDHWLLYGLRELYRDRPLPLYERHAQKLVTAIATAQHTRETGERADWNGGYYVPPRSTPTATRTEGLTAAYEIFRVSGDTVHQNVAENVIKRGVMFQLRTQFNEEKVRSLGADSRGIGGFHESLTEYAVRIDYVQHNISALLGAHRLGISIQ